MARDEHDAEAVTVLPIVQKKSPTGLHFKFADHSRATHFQSDTLYVHKGISALAGEFLVEVHTPNDAVLISPLT